MELSRQEFWSGLPFPSPGDLPNLGIELRSPTLQADSLHYFILFDVSVILHCLYVSLLLYPSLYEYTCRLLSCLIYYKQCYNEHCGVWILRTIFSLNIWTELGLQDHNVALFLAFVVVVFWVTSYTLEGNVSDTVIVIIPVYIPTSSIGWHPSLYPLSSIYCLKTFRWHSDLCELISYCSFDLHFSNN